MVYISQEEGRPGQNDYQDAIYVDDCKSEKFFRRR